MDKHEPISPPQAPSGLGMVAQLDRVPGPWLQLTVPRGFEWNPYRLPVEDLPAGLEGFRIVQIADLHLRAFWSDVYDQLIDRVRREAPDLILMSGDLVNNKRNHTKEAPFARRLVSQLNAPHGVF